MGGGEHGILDLLIKHELAIMDLYANFAGLSGGFEDFWKSIAADEKNHASWLSEMQSDPFADDWFNNESQLKKPALETSIKYVEKMTAMAKEGRISPDEAFSIAKDIESALLERFINKVKDRAPREIKTFIGNLARETERHLNSIVDFMDSEKPKMADESS